MELFSKCLWWLFLFQYVHLCIMNIFQFICVIFSLCLLKWNKKSTIFFSLRNKVHVSLWSYLEICDLLQASKYARHAKLHKNWWLKKFSPRSTMGLHSVASVRFLMRYDNVSHKQGVKYWLLQLMQFFFSIRHLQLFTRLGLLLLEVPRSHTRTHHSR